MAIRNIVKEGDPILNKVCRPVTNFDDRLATLLDDMRETMIAADGVGLAGPQVGMLRRLFVVWDTTDAPEEIPEDYEYKFIDFVNPEILAVSEEEETAFMAPMTLRLMQGISTRPATGSQTRPSRLVSAMANASAHCSAVPPLMSTSAVSCPVYSNTMGYFSSERL